MTIELQNIGKRFNREWIFRDVNLALTPGQHTGIVGPNGSGKSTLLQCISGYLVPSEGAITYRIEDRVVPQEEVFRHVSIAAPYLEQDEWLTFREAVEMQRKFKPFRHGMSANEVIERSGLTHASDRYLRQFSSGMKQRVRLVLAVLAETDLLLLDEPTSNLDQAGMDWLSALLAAETKERALLVCSNHHPVELAATQRQVDLSQFKANG